MTKKWGKYIWYFFHSLAENIDDNLYDKNKEYICSLIKNICSLLPCPSCSKHAVKYTKSLDHNKINKREKLQQYLFKFHNDVNNRLKKPQFNQLEMYKKSKFLKIYTNFSYYFQNSNYIYDNFSDKLNRNHLIKDLNNFINNNINNFNIIE